MTLWVGYYNLDGCVHPGIPVGEDFGNWVGNIQRALFG